MNALEIIQEATKDLAEDRRRYLADLKAKALEYAAIADAQGCLDVINVLIETVSSITGLAPELEDAACILEQHIESEKK